MKNTFPGYYQPTEEAFQKLWSTCVFVLDANVLLNLYRYSPETSKELIDILHSISNRVWLPYQFALEYHKYFHEIKSTLSEQYDTTTKSLNATKDNLLKDLRNLKNRTRIEVEDWLNGISTALEKIEIEIEERKQAHLDWLNNDNLSETIADLFDGKIGSNYSNERLEALYKEGKKRYERKQPPGYGDQKEKPEPERYGDLIAWFQIIDYTKTGKKPLILVTEDVNKGDWHLRASGKTIGPRPELVQEIHHEANVDLYIYPTDQFMKYARQYIHSPVTDDAISEVQVARENNEAKAQMQLTEQLVSNLAGPFYIPTIMDSVSALSAFAGMPSALSALPSAMLPVVSLSGFLNTPVGMPTALSALGFPSSISALSSVMPSIANLSGLYYTPPVPPSATQTPAQPPQFKSNPNESKGNIDDDQDNR